jgi:hypothetical protein
VAISIRQIEIFIDLGTGSVFYELRKLQTRVQGGYHPAHFQPNVLSPAAGEARVAKRVIETSEPARRNLTTYIRIFDRVRTVL